VSNNGRNYSGMSPRICHPSLFRIVFVHRSILAGFNNINILNVINPTKPNSALVTSGACGSNDFAVKKMEYQVMADT
jgi:hypothetical protein